MRDDTDTMICHMCGEPIPEEWRHVQAGDWHFHMSPCWERFKEEHPESLPITTASSGGEVMEVMPSKRK